jgi:hypothetical protein
MTTLRFPSPAAFTQSLRMRRNGAPSETKFLVVEGVSDKKSFQPLLDPDFHYVPARGKEMVLAAFDTLTAEGVTDCLFIVDCDGDTDQAWLGHRGLIVSTNRDIDADLLFDLGAFHRVSLEFLSDFGFTAAQCGEIGNNLLDYARAVTASLGILLDAARDSGANTKFLDHVVGGRRRIRLKDFAESALWVQNFVPVVATDLLPAASSSLGWTAGQEQRILEKIAVGSRKLCRTHQLARCPDCTPRRFSNGHDLVDVLALGLSQRCGYKVTEAEFARATRLATSAGAMDAWEVAIRIRRWQAAA